MIYPADATSVVCAVCYQLGSTAIGIQTSEGIVLAVEKRVTSPLIEPASIEKIMEVDSHIGNNIINNVYYNPITDFIINACCL